MRWSAVGMCVCVPSTAVTLPSRCQPIATFSDPDLTALEEILELPDPVLADWLTGRTPIPDNNPMLRAIREAALG